MSRKDARGRTGRAARAPETAGAAPRVAAPASERAVRPPWIAFVVLALSVIVLVLAPAAWNWVWAVNGFRSLPRLWRLAPAGAALLAVVAALSRPRRAWIPLLVALALAAVLAFLVPESIHWLGDTANRIAAIASFAANRTRLSLPEWARLLHAQPIDVAHGLLLPVVFVRSGASVPHAIAWVSFLTALAYAIGLWRITARLGVPPVARFAFALALAANGSLEAFAGYAESAGLLLAALVWWWCAALAPLTRRRAAVAVAAGWLAVFLVHRMALGLIPALAWRAWGPGLAGDTRAARRDLRVGAIAAVAAAALAILAGIDGGRIAADAQELVGALGRGVHALPPSDFINGFLLVAPLLIVTPWVAGLGALREAARRADVWLIAVAAVPLVPLMWLIPAATSSLGAHRDWDKTVAAGWTLTLLAGAVLARLPAPRLRGALLWTLPVLVFAASGWVGINANARRSVRRAVALANTPPMLPGPARASLHDYLGRRASDLGRPDGAAPHFEEAFILDRDPKYVMHACQEWLRAGQIAKARFCLARAREVQPVRPDLAAGMDQLQQSIDTATADSTRRAHERKPGTPAGLR